MLIHVSKRGHRLQIVFVWSKGPFNIQWTYICVWVIIIRCEDDTEPPTLSSSSIKTNSKCSVQTYAATTVSSMEDIRRAYDIAITMCRRTPDSIVYAFRFDDNRGLKQNFESVGEGGIGFHAEGAITGLEWYRGHRCHLVWKQHPRKGQRLL